MGLAHKNQRRSHPGALPGLYGNDFLATKGYHRQPLRRQSTGAPSRSPGPQVSP